MLVICMATNILKPNREGASFERKSQVQMKNYHTYLWLIVLSILLSCSRKPNDQAAENSIEKLKIKDLNDQPIDIKQYQRKVVFINFWATWCRPCIEEMPSIDRARAKLQNENIEFLVASNEEPDRIKSFIKNHNFELNYVKLDNLEELKIQALPTTFIFDQKGKLVFSETGYRQWDDPENIEMITKIIKSHE